MAGLNLSFHGVKRVIICSHRYFGPSESHPTGFCMMELSLEMDDKTYQSIALFDGDGKGIDFKNTWGDARKCDDCKKPLPHEWHPQVFLCADCETDAAPSEGPQVDGPVRVVR